MRYDAPEEVQMIEAQERHDIEPSQVDRANAIIEALEQEGFDMEWLYATDAEYAMNYDRDNHKYGQSGEDGVLAVPDDAHKAIWEGEILGQISDGAWENYWWESPYANDSWRKYFKLGIVIDEDIAAPEVRGTSLPVSLDYHDELTRLDAQVGRMMFYGRAVDDDFDEDDLNRVLLGFEGM